MKNAIYIFIVIYNYNEKKEKKISRNAIMKNLNSNSRDMD